jgi:hypothetical protein
MNRASGPIPPRAVEQAVKAVADEGTTYTTYNSEPPTTWRVWVATTAELVSVEVQYDKLGYDLAEENLQLKPTEPTYVKAWSRPLRTVERTDYVMPTRQSATCPSWPCGN